jgi:aldose sugar dehydrogenase
MENEAENVVSPTGENIKRCLCPICPAYDECMKNKGEILYCSQGTTTCKLDKRGCHCVRCPVQLEYGLVGLFYCEKGAVKELGNKRVY